MASRSRTKRLWVLSIAGGSALLVAGAFAASWPLVLARYRCQRLDQAGTYEEAKPWLDLLAADGAGPRTGGSALLSSLGGSRPRLTSWFFQGVVENALPAGIVEAFARRIEGDEALLAAWSHYVRWVMGDSAWSYLSGLCMFTGTGEEAPAGLFPCVTPGTSLPVSGSVRVSNLTIVHAHTPARRLEVLAIAWFLGMMPLPRLDEGVEAQLAAWLAGARPFLRHSVYDESLGRCKRETEIEPLPTLTPFSERGLPVPEIPLPGWTGTPPPRPSRTGAVMFTPAGGLFLPPAGRR